MISNNIVLKIGGESMFFRLPSLSVNLLNNTMFTYLKLFETIQNLCSDVYKD